MSKAAPTLKDDEIQAARIFGLLPVSTINKNKIAIHHIASTISPLANDHDTAYSSYQKTSITINVSDQITTVNVSDHDKHYHSSILIRSKSHQDNDAYNEETFSENRNEDQLSGGFKIDLVHAKSANKIATVVEKKLSIKPENANSNKTKTLICLDYNGSRDAEHMLPGNNNEGMTNFTEENELKTSKSLDSLDNCIPKFGVDSFILKLLSDTCFSHLLYGLEINVIVKIIQNSLARLPVSVHHLNSKLIKDTEVNKSLLKRLHDIIKEERSQIESITPKLRANSGSSPSNNSTSLHLSNLNDTNRERTGNTSNDKSEIIPVRKIYETLINPSLLKEENSTKLDIQHDHQYESICMNCDPIYEEISEEPPPLPTNPPPISSISAEKSYKPMFLGATKYDILSYLVDAKDRISAPEESYTFKFLRRSTDETITLKHMPEDDSKMINIVRERSYNAHKLYGMDKSMASIERNDSGVGSETSKTSRTKYRPSIIENKSIPPIHLCEDCGK